MTEINERLARFAGLHRNEPTGGTWWDKDGHTVDILFTESLDAQAKYLWPRLGRVRITYTQGEAAAVKVLRTFEGRGVFEENNWSYAEAPTPALASAQAIAKLLEGK